MRLILTILLIGLFKADAQVVINASAPYRSAFQFKGLLDDYSGAAATYSLRKLDKDYTGSAIRVRKDTTGQPEQDIGFTANGDLDTASLKSFLNARSGFVVKWYSQGDSSSVDFEQTTQTSQPRIANLGVIDRRLGKPSIFFDGTNDFMDIPSSTNRFNYLHNVAGDASVFLVFQPGVVADPNASYIILDNTSASSSFIGYSLFFDDRTSVPRNETFVHFNSRGGATVHISNVSQSLFCPPNIFNLYTILSDNNNTTISEKSKLYRNGTNEQKNNTINQSGNNANASFNLRFGRRANATDFNFSGYMSEIIIYPNITISKSGVETNINNYYGIY